MKTLKLITAMILLSAVFFTGCKEDDDDMMNPQNLGGTLTAKIDGTDWTATLGVVATSEGGLVTVTGSGPNADQLQVIANNVTGPGTYNIGGLGNNNTGRWTNGLDPQNDTYSANFALGSGSITITTLSATKVEGTFAFTATNLNSVDVNVTEGSFSADL